MVDKKKSEEWKIYICVEDCVLLVEWREMYNQGKWLCRFAPWVRTLDVAVNPKQTQEQRDTITAPTNNQDLKENTSQLKCVGHPNSEEGNWLVKKMFLASHQQRSFMPKIKLKSRIKFQYAQ